MRLLLKRLHIVILVVSMQAATPLFTLSNTSNEITGKNDGLKFKNLSSAETTRALIQPEALDERTQESCPCEDFVITDFLGRFNDPGFFFNPAHVDGPPQTLTIFDLNLMSSACKTSDDSSFCGQLLQLQYCFVNSETGQQIVSWPEKGITYVASANELTLQPLAGDPIGIQKILLRIYHTYSRDVIREVEILFQIKSENESQLPEQKKVEIFTDNADIFDDFEQLQHQSTSIVSTFDIAAISPNHRNLQTYYQNGVKTACTGSTTNLNLMNTSVQAQQGSYYAGYNPTASVGCDGFVQNYNPSYSSASITFVSTPSFWVAEFLVPVFIKTILFIERMNTSIITFRVGNDITNNYFNNPACTDGTQTTGGWFTCGQTGKYLALTATSNFLFMEVFAYSQEAIQIKAKSASLSSTLISSAIYLCTTGTNCQASNVLRKALVIWNNQPSTTSCCIYSTQSIDPTLTVTFNADVLIDSVVCLPSDQNGSSVFVWQTNIEIWISNSAGVLQLCGTLTDYNTYKEVSCNKVGNKIIVKKPGSSTILAMAGFGALSSCDCSKSSFNPAQISLPNVNYVSATTLNGSSIDSPMSITFNTQILDTVSSVCGTADGITKCGLRSSISFADKSTGSPITVWPYFGYSWNSATSVLSLDFSQAAATSVLTATLSLAGFPTVTWSQDIISTVLKTPDTPLAPTTLVNLNTSVTITWVAPSNGGSAIIAYTVKIKASNGSYTDLAECNGASPAIDQAQSCTIPILTLQVAPFTIVSGTGIYAIVGAKNIIGSSAASSPGNGAVMPQACSASTMSVKVVHPSTDASYIPDKQNSQFVITWADFLLKQNLGCKAVIKYEVSVQTLSGSVDSKWFTFDLVQRKIFFNILAPYTDSNLRIEITGRINGDISLASAVDKFTFSVLNSKNQVQQTENNSQSDAAISTSEIEAKIESTTAEIIIVKWVPPQQKKVDSQRAIIPLISQILSIDSKGLVKIGFSKLIMIPDQFRNLTARQKAGNYTETIQNLISVKVDPQLSESDLYKIKSVNLIEFSSSYFILNVTFENPNSITTEVRTPDFLAVQILNTDHFIGLVDYDRVKNDTAMIKELPPQLTAVQQKKIEKLEETVSSGFTIVASTNIVVNILLASGLKYFWGMINVLQFLVFMTRWKLNYPPNALATLNFIKMIALMEFLPTGWFTDTVSDWFGIQKGDESNIVENMGMMLLIGCTVILIVLFMLAVGLLVLYNYKLYRVFRMVQRKIFYNTLIRYVLQSTLKLQIASITTITLKTWDQGKTQMMIAGTVVAVLSVMPFVFIGVLIRNFKSLAKPSMVEKIGSFYTGLKTGEKWATVAYSFIFLIRRQIFVALTFIMVEQPSLQVHLFIYMLLWYVIYIESVLPHETRFLTTQEHANEIFMLIICYHFVLFTGIVPEIEVRDTIGWSLNGFLCLMIAFNIVILVTVSLRTLLRKFKLWKLKRNQAQAIKERLKAKVTQPNIIAVKQKLSHSINGKIIPSEDVSSQLFFTTVEDVKNREAVIQLMAQPNTLEKPFKMNFTRLNQSKSVLKKVDFKFYQRNSKPAVTLGQQFRPEIYNLSPDQVSRKINAEKRMGVPSSVFNTQPVTTPGQQFKPEIYNLSPGEVAKKIVAELRMGVPSTVFNYKKRIQTQVTKAPLAKPYTK